MLILSDDQQTRKQLCLCAEGKDNLTSISAVSKTLAVKLFRELLAKSNRIAIIKEDIRSVRRYCKIITNRRGSTRASFKILFRMAMCISSLSRYLNRFRPSVSPREVLSGQAGASTPNVSGSRWERRRCDFVSSILSILSDRTGRASDDFSYRLSRAILATSTFLPMLAK